MKTLTLGLGLLMATSAQAEWGGYHELGTTYSRKTPKGGTEQKVNLGGYSFLNINNKLSDNWSIAGELYTTASYITAGEGNFDQDHRYIRFNAVRKNIKLLEGWDSNYRLRWIPLTGLKTQGGLGDFQYRLSFSKSTGAFSFAWKPYLTLALVDSGYQKLTTPGGTQEGNELLEWGVELVPTYEVSKGWTVGGYTALYQAYTGGAPGADGSVGSVGLYLEPSVSLPIHPAFDFSLAAATSTTLNDKFDIDLGGLTYLFKIGKAF